MSATCCAAVSDRPRCSPYARHTRHHAAPGVGRLFAELQHCVPVHDAATKEILWANPAACDILGSALDELKPLKATDMSSNARQYADATALSCGWQ